MKEIFGHIKSGWGFTLVELLVSISIISVLTAILLPNFLGARERAKDSQRKQDLYAMKNALRLYYNENQSYPNSGGAWIKNVSSSIGQTLAVYMPGVLNVGYTYEYQSAPPNDGFFLRVKTMASSPTDNNDSQVRCGIAPGSVDTTYFMTCAN